MSLTKLILKSVVTTFALFITIFPIIMCIKALLVIPNDFSVIFGKFLFVLATISLAGLCLLVFIVFTIFLWSDGHGKKYCD